MTPFLRLAAGLFALSLTTPAFAGDPPPPAVPPARGAPAATPAPLPAWDQLSTEQRELLIAPLRERWNASPDDRGRMLDHARRWRDMPPEERERARRGMRRFEQMKPEQRDHARALFNGTRDMSPEQRKAFLQRWEKMDRDERKAWLRAHPVPDER